MQILSLWPELSKLLHSLGVGNSMALQRVMRPVTSVLTALHIMHLSDSHQNWIAWSKRKIQQVKCLQDLIGIVTQAKKKNEGLKEGLRKRIICCCRQKWMWFWWVMMLNRGTSGSPGSCGELQVQSYHWDNTFSWGGVTSSTVWKQNWWGVAMKCVW